MKTLILAAALALTSTPSMAEAPAPNSTVTQDQVLAEASHIESQCLLIMTGQKSADQVIKEDKLDTVDKRKALVVQCIVLQDAFQAGVQAGKPKENVPTT